MVTFLSDFGLRDVFVGVVEATVRAAAPEVPFVHLGHELPPHDVVHGALMLYEAAPYLPDGCVVLAVVDPGVGSARRAVAAQGERLWWVAPDNGLLGFALELDPPRAAVELRRVRPPRPNRPSSTFHGRDLFGPAAAALARGKPLAALGPSLAPEALHRHPDGLSLAPEGHPEGIVLSFDRFGNAITNLRCAPGLQAGHVEVAGRRIPLGTHYSEVPPGIPIAVVGSAGLLEVSVREGSARDVLGLRRGSPVRLVEGPGT